MVLLTNKQHKFCLSYYCLNNKMHHREAETCYLMRNSSVYPRRQYTKSNGNKSA